MKLKLIIGLGLSICLGSLFGALVIPQLNSSSSPMDLWLDYVLAKPLVDGSELIIMATYLDSTTHKIPVVSPVDGKAHYSLTEVYRRFKVVNSLKGDFKADEDIHVVWTAGYSKDTDGDAGGDVEFVPYSTVSLESGQEYIVFLYSLPRTPGYPKEYGSVVWTIPGEPGVAVVNKEGMLLFQASERYKDQVDEGGYQRPAGSAAPFELSMDDLKEMITAPDGDK